MVGKPDLLDTYKQAIVPAKRAAQEAVVSLIRPARRLRIAKRPIHLPLRVEAIQRSAKWSRKIKREASEN